VVGPDDGRIGRVAHNDTLERDLTAETFRAGTHGCGVLTGRLADPYTAKAIAFDRSRANAVQVDHVIAP
jgi:hypothetical protein